MQTNRTCVVVGGTHGIGLAIAKKFLMEGASLVIICSRKKESVDQALEKVLSPVANHNNARVVGTTLNVSNLNDIPAFVEFCKNELNGRKLDVLVSNVGVDPKSGRIVDATDALFDKIFTTNVKAAWVLVKLFHPLMHQGSSISFMSSTGGLQPAYPSGLYGTSKSALIALGRVLAEELGPDGIRVNVICPGLVKTRMSEAFWKSEYGPKAEQTLFLRRLGEPDDIADVTCFVCSDKARWMTGEALVVSGGTYTRL